MSDNVTPSSKERLFQYHEFQLVDHKAREDFEKLLGITTHAPSVRVPHDVYERHADAIQGIQMSAAMRIKR